MDIIASYSSDDSNGSLQVGKSDNADFFNLESSDTDDELSDSQRGDIQSLLNSASILSNNSYGPTYQIENNPEMQIIKEHEFCPERPDVPECKEETKYIDTAEHLWLDLEIHPSKIISNEKTKIDDASGESYPKDEKVFYRSDPKIIQANTEKKICNIPKRISHVYDAHCNPVTSLRWCIPQYSHLLLTSSIDRTLKVWDISCKRPAKVLHFGSSLKSANWTCDGKKVTCGGFEKTAHVIDIFTGKQVTEYEIGSFVTSIENHSQISEIFLVGTKNKIFAFDTRNSEDSPIRSYSAKFNDVLDIAFLNEKEFVCSTSIVSHDSADRTIMAWDFSSGALLSNQIYLERYTCPCLKVEPSGETFIAQTNGDYIAAFSAKRPYKMKNKRYMGHKVSGYGIQCDISPDERYLASGDANGNAYIYDYHHSNLIKTLPVSPGLPINCIQWHPVLSNTIATSSWDGNIQIWS